MKFAIFKKVSLNRLRYGYTIGEWESKYYILINTTHMYITDIPMFWIFSGKNHAIDQL